ncbi:sugar transferase [Virgibacillus sp. W0181]|uniref:sugar transferase n=1 Tax=Virgibacillus sp. W0181 TaxID=3391581 RepID=UPI003F462610
MKRGVDLFIAVFMLAFFSPLLFVIAIVIKRDMGSPVLFIQQRPGQYCRPFYLIKFRTMNNKTDLQGNLLPDHIRLTAVGKFLRKYSLDELPQLLNVVKGEMSLVGPRPLLMEYVPLFTEEENRRHQVKPGITGWAQVNGRNAISWEQKFELDSWYVKNHSFMLDLKILLQTIGKVCRKEGINQENQATVEKFKRSKEVIQYEKSHYYR